MQQKQITALEMKTLIKAQQGELNAVLMYRALAKNVKDPEDAKLFLQLASEEGHHAAVFRKLTGKKLKPGKGKAVLLPLLYKVIGRKKLYPMIANGEYAAAKTYEPVVERFPETESVKNDEKRHGDMIMDLLKS